MYGKKEYRTLGMVANFTSGQTISVFFLDQKEILEAVKKS